MKERARAWVLKVRRRLVHPITIYKFWRLFRAYGEASPWKLARRYAAPFW